MSDLTFTPFYEGGRRWPFGLIGKVIVAAGLGLLFLVPHGIAVNGRLLHDWSWLLAVLISTAMLALYYASDTLRGLLPGMSLRLRAKDGENRDNAFMTPFRRWRSDGYFVLAGLLVGLLNTWMGYMFGVPDPGSCAYYTTLFGFFLAGFICGMATFGIVVVTIVVSHFAKSAEETFDYTAPDHCGGVQFVGEGLVVFSSITLVVGVMISIYIRVFPWTNETGWVMALQWGWIILPYALSLIVLVWPAVPLNDALRRYKIEQDEIQIRALADIERKLAANPDGASKKELREDHAYLQNVRKELHGMGTWPHGMSANAKYLGIFAVNLAASSGTALSLYEKWHGATHGQ